MDKDRFNAILPIIIGDLVKKIAIELNISDKDAITKLYLSHLYELLEKEQTKFWQYSTEKLFEMFSQEVKSGKISYPQIWGD